MTTERLKDDTAADDTPSPKPYVAVVVFHGMGQQRHYESVWRIVEALDAWIFGRMEGRGTKFKDKRLLLKTRREQLRDESAQPKADGLAYVEARYAGASQAEIVRFYEGYWAPATVAGTSVASVVTWLFAQITRPLKVLWAPWRSFGRLRRADLQNLMQAMRTAQQATDPVASTGPSAKDTNGQDPARWLLMRYAEFVKQRPPEPGTFKSFLRYVEKKATVEPFRQQVLALARRWRRVHCFSLLRGTCMLLLIGLSIVSLCFLVVLGSLELLQALVAIDWLTSALDRFGAKLESTWSTAASLAAAVAVLSGVAGFLRNVIGDVQQFVTYQETDELHERRAKIMAEAQKTLRHVLADDRCQRVVVFGHSLGSAVALDTILGLRALNECAAPRQTKAQHMLGPIKLNKIEQFITCGSPIDKIGLLFATLSSEVRGFEMMFDDLRGDIGDIPFSKDGGSPHMHWTNFWDQGDPISGPLETVMPAEPRQQRVDNVQIASLAWPDVIASHDSYFENPAVIGHLYDVAFLGGASFASPPRDTPLPGHTEGRPRYEWLGPGQGWLVQSLLLLLIPTFLAVLVWAALGALVPPLPAPAIWHVGIFAGVLLIGALLQRLQMSRSLDRRSQRLTSAAGSTQKSASQP